MTYNDQLAAWLAKHGVATPQQARGDIVMSDIFDTTKGHWDFSVTIDGGELTIRHNGLVSISYDANAVLAWVKRHGKLRDEDDMLKMHLAIEGFES